MFLTMKIGLLSLWISKHMRQKKLNTLWKKQRVVAISWQNAYAEIGREEIERGALGTCCAGLKKRTGILRASEEPPPVCFLKQGKVYQRNTYPNFSYSGNQK